ncbi:helix-turn-helix domain-containing protein [Clostridium grantii]|uniref:AraC-type DNA-binding protein n=1 Tax=Clostridium grantii DSM 8605 TaxID=1121316 RepID=A0A1M5WNL6_9CLOT|nr:AraC family transcriptional regulator [Clostridium grantii]SHH88563.1 AraC-type DNA-binding protein [Clostridium grantii DSM 8605]
MIKRKYFKKLFIIFFTFTLVYGMTMTSYFVYENKKSLKTQQVNYIVNQADQIVKNLDQRLWSLNKYTDTLFLNEYIKDYIVTNEDYYTITKVYNKLQTDMSVFSDMGGRIAITKLVDDFVISNQSTRKTDAYFDEIGFTQEMIAKVYEFYDKKDNINETIIIANESYEEIHILKKNRMNKEQKLIIFSCVNAQMLKTDDDFTSFNFYMEGRNDQVGVIAKQISDSKKEYVILDDVFYLLRTSSVYPDLKYIITSPYIQNSSLNSKYLLASLIFLASTVVGFLIAIIITKSIYKPIGAVISNFSEGEEESMDEFKFIQNMTNDMIKANKELKDMIKNNKVDLKTKFFRECLSGIISKKQIQVKIDEYNLETFLKPCRVVYIVIEEMEDYKATFLSDARANVRAKVKDIIKNLMTIEGLSFELIELNSNAYAMILGELDENQVRAYLVKILNAIELDERANLVMGIGEQVETIYKLQVSYQNIKSVFEYRQSYDKRAIFSIKDVVSNNIHELFYYTLDMEKELFNATINGVLEKINLLFNEIIVVNFNERNLEVREKASLLISLVNTLRRVEQKITLKDKFKEKVDINKLLLYNKDISRDHICEVRDIFISYGKLANEKTVSKDKEILVMMTSYIENHYQEDLSLEHVANYLNISSGYFCTIFKKVTGTNFKNFLNQYRVKKAKYRLELDPDIKIKDLTSELGFNNANSFIRMFKKYEGISPGEYARQYYKRT